MRVLLVHHTAVIGGSLQSLLVTVDGLVSAGCEVIVSVAQASSEVEAAIVGTGAALVVAPGLVTYHHTGGSREPLWTRRGIINGAREIMGTVPRSLWTTMARMVDATRPDIVHLNSLVLAPVAAVLQRMCQPYVWHVREPLHLGRFGLRAQYFRDLASRAGSRMIYISEWDRKQLGATDTGLLLENFVDLGYWDDRESGLACRARLGLSPDDFVILYLGGPSAIKGPDVLIEAFSIVRGRIPGAKLLAPGLMVPDAAGRLRGLARGAARRVGKPPFRDRVWRRIAELGLSDSVCAATPAVDVRPFYAACDVVAFPSVIPHFARPAVEAMACAKAFVGSDLPGVSALVHRDRTGLLVAPRDPMALANALETLGRDTELCDRMGRDGRDEAERRFSSRVQIPRLLAHYEAVLAHAVAPPDVDTAANDEPSSLRTSGAAQ